ncbi:hypothetical protein EJ03DRAFT_186243 [Teratosphaeria nubilosa]|uniref:Uncharacterized protein n=1 Tax=Teratosphaeria nubilosa TaxID=161662 RepID=A0A6G1LK14_9PEZI|nr:hypothetical protein EJ03DRAFT_186243 [Teratosphaeria nubilosa]
MQCMRGSGSQGAVGSCAKDIRRGGGWCLATTSKQNRASVESGCETCGWSWENETYLWAGRAPQDNRSTRPSLGRRLSVGFVVWWCVCSATSGQDRC